MADATDQPAEGAGALPPAAEAYRPLSLLALAGFLLGATYALVVLVGGAVALVNRAPWLMPPWAFVLPLAAVVVCWAARVRIRDSEGVLSGQALTTWGIRLAVVVALLYAAYYAATFFVVRHLAGQHADRFLEALRQRQPQQAYLLAVGLQPRDFDEAETRDLLEGRFTGPTGYARFGHAQFVRLLELAGPAARVEPLGVLDWGYGNGGYRAVLKYHVATSLAEFDLILEAFGRDAQPGQSSRGRQWQIVLTRDETFQLRNEKLTEEGRDYMLRAQLARNVAADWAERANLHQWEEAGLDAQPPARRGRLLEGLKAVRAREAAAAAGPAPLGLFDDAGRDFQSWQRQRAGTPLLRVDETNFWSAPAQRKATLRRIAETLRSGPDPRPFQVLLPQEGSLPVGQEKDGRMVMRVDVELRFPDPKTGRPDQTIEGRLVVAADAAEATRPEAWWVEALEPLRGRTVERPPGAPGAGRPPG